MSNLLAELKDVHVYYRKIIGIQQYPYYSPRQIKDWHATSEKVISKYFNEKLKKDKSRSVKYGITPENIGYIHIQDFHKTALIPEFQKIINSMSDTKGLIIDIRSPKGGDYNVTQAIISNFLTDTIRKPKFYLLGEHIKQPYFIPQENTFIYNKGIIVLINGRTISAGEMTTEILKQLPNVTAIGDTTSGGGGANSGSSPQAEGEFRLPNRMIICVPAGCFMRYDSLHYEWNGIPPDIRVEQTEADIKDGRDKQLEYAISLLK
jgi:C-terminal processing protease CtpA/Prc